MSIYYPAGKNSSQPIKDCKNYIYNHINNYNVNNLIQDVRPPVQQQYYSLNYVTLYNSGYAYPESTTLVIESPPIPEGSQATCTPSFGLTRYSLEISGVNSIGDKYIIFPSESNEDINNQAIIEITAVDEEGAVVCYSVLDTGSNFTNSSEIVVYKEQPILIEDDAVLSQLIEISTNITLIPDKFCISKVYIDDEGAGYSRYNEFGDTIEYVITTTNSENGSGFYATLQSKYYFTLELVEIKQTRSINRNRNLYKDKYNNTIIQGSSAQKEKRLYNRVLHNPTKTNPVSIQKYHSYSFDKTTNAWIALETIYPSSSSEDKCSTFDNNGYLVAGLAFSAPNFDFMKNLDEPPVQSMDLREVARIRLKARIKSSVDNVLSSRYRIRDVFKEYIGDRFVKGKNYGYEYVFERGFWKKVGEAIELDLSADPFFKGVDPKALGFCTEKELADFVFDAAKEALYSDQGKNSIRAGIIESINALYRLDPSLGDTWKGFSLPITIGNITNISNYINRILTTNLANTPLTWLFDDLNSYVTGVVSRNFNWPEYECILEKPKKPTPKIKRGLLQAIQDRLKKIRPPRFSVKCINGKSILKGTGKAAGKVLGLAGIYFLLEELARAQDELDVGVAVLNFAAPLPPEWFVGPAPEFEPIIDPATIPQQDIDQLEQQIQEAIAQHVLNPNEMVLTATLNNILENFASKTVNDFGQPLSQTEIQQILTNIISDAESIKDQITEDVDLDSLNEAIKKLKTELEMYEYSNKKLEETFIEVFGSDDLCVCPGNLEDKQKEFEEKIMPIFSGYNENIQNQEPKTEKEWQKLDQRLLGFPSELLSGGFPKISITRIPIDEKDDIVLPTPKDPTNEKFFNDLDMYKIQ